jgi:hypothetical protein
LLHIIRALRAAGRFACGLNRRQQHRDKNADDRDHDEQFHERESRQAPPRTTSGNTSSHIDLLIVWWQANDSPFAGTANEERVGRSYEEYAKGK